MRARRLASGEIAGMAPATLAGGVLLAPVRLGGGVLPKGATLDAAAAEALVAAAAAGGLARGLRIAWPDADDVHENAAAEELARAVGGAGVQLRGPRQSRIDLVATWDGVLHVAVEGLARVNAIDAMEVFTLFDGQTMVAGETAAAVKVAPHLLPRPVLREAVRTAREHGPLVEVRPFVPTRVGAIVAETMDLPALERFETAARRKVEGLGSAFDGIVALGELADDDAVARARDALEELALRRALPVLLVGGVSAGDPIAPFYAALRGLGGTVVRHGAPAHPGSMLWLARLGRTQLLGLPQCGMFSMATAADLILPRLLTGETVDAGALRDLGHGGLLGREMRFRMPRYARELDTPDHP